MRLAYFPIEVFVREFPAKLALAYNLAQNNFATIMAEDRFLTQLLTQIQDCKTGVFFDKSCNKIQLEKYQNLKSIQKIFVHDEEGPQLETDKLYFNRFSEEALRITEGVLCWGETEFAQLAKIKGNSDKLYITGSPRFDLMGDLRYLFKEESAALNSIFGQYVLINSNVPNPANEKSLIASAQKGGEVRNSNDLALLSELVEKYNKLRIELQSFVVEFAKTQPNKTILFRRHPVDNSNWNFGQFRNVMEISHGPVEPYILGSETVIGAGCTTLLQAGLAKKNIINVNFEANSATRVHILIDELVKTLTDQKADPLQEQNYPDIARYVSNFSGATAIEKIKAVFSNVDLPEIDLDYINMIANTADKYEWKETLKFPLDMRYKMQKYWEAIIRQNGNKGVVMGLIGKKGMIVLPKFE